MKVRAPDLGSKWRLYADNLLAPLCRKRNGSMTPKVHIPKHQTRWHGFDDKILSLYARGMTVREIQVRILSILC